MIFRSPTSPGVSPAPWLIGAGVGGSAVAGAAIGAGISIVPFVLLVLCGVLVAVAVRRTWEMSLVALAATVFIPLPASTRPLIIGGAVAVIVLSALLGRHGVDRAGELSTAQIGAIAGIGLMTIVLGLSAAASPDSGELPSFFSASVVALFFLWALCARGNAVGPMPIAAGVALASVASSAIVLLRLGGLPLIGSNGGSAYADAKSVVVSELGDVNGQALIIMLGLPILFAVALRVRGRAALAGAAACVLLSSMALVVLLSRSALVGAVAGCAVVVLAMTRLSPKRVTLTLVLCVAAAFAFGRDIQSVTADQTNLGLRSTLWSNAFDFWRESPIVGNGPDAWPRLIAENVLWAPEGGAGGTHNLLLSGLVAGGLLTVALQVSLILLVLWAGVSGLQRLAAAPNPVLQICLSGGLGSFAAQVARGGFEATGWPGVRAYDLRTWGGLLLISVVALVLVSSAAAIRASDPQGEIHLGRP